MKKRITALAMALLLLGSACGAQSTAANTSATAGSAGSAASEASVPESFLGQETAQPSLAESILGGAEPIWDAELTPSVPEFTVESDLSNVINAEKVNYWTDEAKARLAEDGFVVLPTGGYEFYEGYEMNRYAYEPNFVTTDAMLHTYHLYFMHLQSQVEEDSLSGLLQQLTGEMLAQSQTQLAALSGSEWENAALRNVAYFAVAQSLLDPSAAVPDEVSETVAQELALIEAAETITDSPVMNLNAAAGTEPVQEDYSQYIPRSYYTSSEELTRYFKAMMWYGRLTFLASNDDQTRSALLMNLALNDGGAMENWERIYTVTSFFAGTSDDACCADYAPLIEQSYGGWPAVADLPANGDAFAQFAQSLAALRPAAVNSIPIYETQDVQEATAGFRFMGQRFTLDASIFQQLTYRNVEENAEGQQRLLPNALDIPAALGSQTALEIIKESGDADYPNYEEKLSAVQDTLAGASDSVWNGSLYAAWLNALRPLTEEKGEGYPQFTQGTAWTAKNLATFLGSWTELKHDTALYAKQSYAEMGGGPIDAADDRGYVETEPVVFGRLALLSQATADGLQTLGVLDESGAEGLALMAELNEKLMVIAEKELKNELPTDEEFELIRSFGGQLEHFWMEVMETDGESYVTPAEHPAALVADVATDPNGWVLQTATGNTGTLYAIVSVDGSLRIATGAVYTYYEFEQPLSERLTDESWNHMLGNSMDENGSFYEGEKPQQADWTQRYTLENAWGA